MTLDQRIRNDLGDLYNKLPINAAVSLNNCCKTPSNSYPFSTHGLPTHFTGDRDAETVLVMLNPGRDAIEADLCLDCELKRFGIDIKNSLKKFIADYIYARVNYGKIDKCRYDGFDIKTALFLQPWKDCGIDFPKGFPDDKLSQIEAKENVLMQKLQLEIVPYSSRIFSTKALSKHCICAFVPFLETVLDEIFRKGRKYVIFCSAFFEKLFNAIYGCNYKGIVVEGMDGDAKRTQLNTKSGGGTKREFKCRPIQITYKGKTCKALIAHSFPIQGLSGDLMKQYGDFCHSEWVKFIP